MAEAVLRVCSACDAEGFAGARDGLQTALEAAGLSARVIAQDCMNACGAPVSLALQGEGRATYFFAGVDPVEDCADVVETVRLFLASPDGWIEDARGCGRLRHCLQGRVPALPER